MVVAETVQGDTARIVLQLQEVSTAGVLGNLDGSGFTVTDLLITTSEGQPLDTGGDFGWVSAAAGTVYYDPDATDFESAHSPYRVRVKLTDGGGKIRSYPGGVAFGEIVVGSQR
jgi:hypothetical protein